MGSRPTGRTVQERLFKRIRISSDCEEPSKHLVSVIHKLIRALR